MENKKTHGGKREGAGRKKISPELKAKPISKVVYARLENSLYEKLENIAKENNLSIGELSKKILINYINTNE